MKRSEARIVDANLNRASEAVRVIEDIARFHITGKTLSAEVKSLRHSIRQVPAGLGIDVQELFEARDPDDDVLRAQARRERDGLIEAASSNFKRLQEALRVLEEVTSGSSEDLPDLRFKAYSLEKRVCRLLSGRSPKTLGGPCLCVIVTRQMLDDPLSFVKEAVSAGAGMIQLREKSLPGRDFEEYAAAVHDITSASGSLLIINDRADIASAVRAEGVHVGQEDIDPREARRIVGEDRIVGVSTHSADEVGSACDGEADYVGFGPVFDTQTKKRPAAGLEALKEAIELSNVPVYAIGGISPENIGSVAETGARCAAVCGSAAKADEPGAAVRSMFEALGRD